MTAAVFGVIASLALFLAWKVFWPLGTAASPFADGFDGFSAALALAAFVALARYGAGVIPVIAACAAVGLLATFAGA